MPMISVLFKVDNQRVAESLREVGEQLNGAGGEAVLDFSAVTRISPGALQALVSLASKADGQTKITLCGVNVDIYKVLKLVKLAPRFSFLT